MDIYSVSGCLSPYFADHRNYWKHNGYWFFDAPVIIRQVALAQQLALTDMTLFYYEAYAQEFDAQQWKPFPPVSGLDVRVVPPNDKTFEGYDVVTFSTGNSPECSPLSCNGLAMEIETNQHCLLPSLERAQQLLEEGKFNNAEPGPYRIFAVYSLH